MRKPTTLIAIIFILAYGGVILFSLASLAVAVRIDSIRGLLMILTAASIYLNLGNFMMYSSRKGIMFRPAHAQFVFTAPIDPKLVLLNGGWLNYVMSVAIWTAIAWAGATLFQVPLWKMGLLVGAGLVLEIALEASIMMFLYANDRLPEKLMRMLRWLIKIFLAAFTLFIVLYFRTYGLSVATAFAFVDWKGLQMIPVIGWQIAAYRLILLGPDLPSAVGAGLYVIFVCGMVIAAFRMRSDGGYYEEAARFADDYAELRAQKKSGNQDLSFGGKKRKFRKVNVRITGEGARAIFYRQLLEYKKEKFFIFSKMTLIAVTVSFIFSYSLRESVWETDSRGVILLGVVAYMSLVMSGYLGKWESELKNPYLYLIPDNPVKKMWYATLMEHVKAFVDGCIICIPVGILWQVNIRHVIYCILIYTVLQADRLYTKVLVQCMVGDLLGNVGQNVMRMLIQTFLLGIGVGVAVLCALFLNEELLYLLLLGYSLAVTVGMSILASLRFETMEQIV